MTDLAGDLMRREIRMARRLARLFRADIPGRLLPWPADIMRRLIDRRSRLIGELAELEEKHRAIAPSVPEELDLTMAALAQEARRGMQRCREVLAETGAGLARL